MCPLGASWTWIGAILSPGGRFRFPFIFPVLYDSGEGSSSFEGMGCSGGTGDTVLPSDVVGSSDDGRDLFRDGGSMLGEEGPEDTCSIGDAIQGAWER